MHAHDVQIHTYRLLSLKIYLAIKHDRAEKDLQAVPTNLFHHQSLIVDQFIFIINHSLIILLTISTTV